MAKNKNKSVNSELVNDVIALIKSVATPLPQSTDPFVIAQHAAGMVRMANTPQQQAVIKLVTDTGAQLIETNKARIKAIS